MTDELVVAEWREYPFTDYDRRGDVVKHRVVLTEYGGSTVDVRHEYRAPGADGYPDEWTEYDVYELRPHGVQHVQRNTQVLRE